MAEDKSQVSNMNNNGSSTNNTTNIIPLSENITRLISEKHEIISTIVDLDLESEETNPFKILKRASRDYIFGLMGWSVDPDIWRKITETLIKQRQILDTNAEFNRIKIAPKTGTSDNYDLLENKKAA